jgi:hypothetical protein
MNYLLTLPRTLWINLILKLLTFITPRPRYVASVCQQYLRIPCNCLCRVLKYVATGITVWYCYVRHGPQKTPGGLYVSLFSFLVFFSGYEGPSRIQLSLCKECHFHLGRWIMAETHKSISHRLMSQVIYISLAIMLCFLLWPVYSCEDGWRPLHVLRN